MRIFITLGFITLMLLGGTLWPSADEIAKTFELRYFDDKEAANGPTDFKGETTTLSTEERVEFLKQYGQYGGVFFNDPKLDKEIATVKEAREHLKTIKEQPLPQVRQRIPLKQWKWVGYRPGQKKEREGALLNWNAMQGVKVEEGALQFEENTQINTALPEQSWRFWLEWKTRIPKSGFSSFHLMSGKEVACAVVFNSKGKIYYTAAGKSIEAGGFSSDKWYHCKLEVDLAENRYNFHLDGKLLADFVLLQKTGISVVERLLIHGAKGQQVDEIQGLGFARTKHRNNLYSIKTFLNEDFEAKPNIHGWQAASYDDTEWADTQLPHVHGGERYAGEDLYLRTTVDVKDFQRATLEAETLDPGGEIWINGEVAAVINNLHPVKVDIGKYLKKNQENVIAVRVNSCTRGTWTNDPYVGWFAGRMFLNLTSVTRIEAVRVHAKGIGDPAPMQFQIELSNEQKKHFKGSLQVRFFPWHPKESDVAVASASIPLTLRPWTDKQIEPVVEVAKPRLWDFEHPNLYRIEVKIEDDKGKAVDDFVITSGIRTVSQEGGTFRINGKPEMLNGPLILGLRPPLEKISAWSRCAPAELLMWDLLQTQRMNGNTIRMAVASIGLNGDGWPDINDPRIAEMGDQMGLMYIWQTSAGLWWGNGWGVDWEGYQKFMKQVYNHPSIVMWEVDNEAYVKDWNNWYQKMHETVYAVDQTRLISGFSHLSFNRDVPQKDRKGNPMKPGWTAPMVVRGNHDAVVGYAADWSKLRKWELSEFYDSPDRAYFNFEQEESIGQPNWNLAKGKPWYQLHSYEWSYDTGSIGRKLECDEWLESQAWQAFSAYESMKKQRMLDTDGFNWCCLHGGLFTVNYHKPLLDYHGHAKLAYYTNGMVLQRTLAGSNDVDMVYGPNDSITPMALNLGDKRIVDLTVEVKDMQHKVVDSRVYKSVALPAGRTVTLLPSYRPKVKGTGHYAIEYTLTSAKAEGKKTDAGASLWKKIDISQWKGTYPCLGDLNNDGRMDYLLYYIGPYTTPARLIALDHDGNLLWEAGDKSATAHQNHGRETPCRGLCTIYDIDQDGKSEVITELWQDGKPMLLRLDGTTGKVEKSVASPFDMSVRNPKDYRSWRSVPKVFITHMQGHDKPPTLLLKYDASNSIPPHAAAFDASLKMLWDVHPKIGAIGHISTVADINGDGCDECILGELVLNGKGETVYEHNFGMHADMNTVAELIPGRGKQVLTSICVTGPVYCLSSTGEILWQKTKEEVSHGQAVWAGDFIPEEPGQEVIVLCSGHVGNFITCRGTDGKTLAGFKQRTTYRAYPDMPTVVRWQGKGELLWIPVDRILVNGWGHVVETLGALDNQVERDLFAGKKKTWLAAQAFALDLCGDERDEMVLYQPYDGEAIFVFTQNTGAKEKQYVPQGNAYNIRSYF
jgi:Glycosyl hydrolases family 2/Rhamnogalacturonan lyase family 11, C-terminal domain/Glycosyl hydrolases family 2, TIM barrel domain